MERKNCRAQCLRVCQRSTWSQPVTHAPRLALLAMAGSQRFLQYTRAWRGWGAGGRRQRLALSSGLPVLAPGAQGAVARLHACPPQPRCAPWAPRPRRVCKVLDKGVDKTDRLLFSNIVVEPLW